MGAYILRRLLMGIPTVLGVLLLLFLLFFVVAEPRDIAKRALTEKAPEEQILKWLETHGYGEIIEAKQEDGSMKKVLNPTPKHVLLGSYFKRMLLFDFGKADLDDVAIADKLRMGVGPDDSVVGQDLLHHRIRNLMIVGSAVLPTSSGANPSLTVAALSLRAMEELSR